MAGYIMFLASEKPSVRYGATFLIASGAFPFGALTSAQVSANVVSDTARSAAIGTNVMLGNIGEHIRHFFVVDDDTNSNPTGGLVATWSFLPFDGPNYPIGNGLNMGACSLGLVVAILLELWMRRDNRKRESRDVDAELSGLSVKQIQDLDWRHPGFRWNP